MANIRGDYDRTHASIGRQATLAGLEQGDQNPYFSTTALTFSYGAWSSGRLRRS